MRVYIAAPNDEAREEMLAKAKKAFGDDITTVNSFEYTGATAPSTCKSTKLWSLARAIEQLSTADVIVVRQDFRYNPCTEIPLLCAKRFDIQILVV